MTRALAVLCYTAAAAIATLTLDQVRPRRIPPLPPAPPPLTHFETPDGRPIRRKGKPRT